MITFPGFDPQISLERGGVRSCVS